MTLLHDCSCFAVGEYCDGTRPEDFDDLRTATEAAEAWIARENERGCWRYWGVHVKGRHLLVGMAEKPPLK